MKGLFKRIKLLAVTFAFMGATGIGTAAFANAPVMAAPADSKTKNGFVKEGNSWVYYKNGKVSGASSDIVNGTINGKSGWWYIKNGKADLTKTSVEHNQHGWWYVKNGKVDFGYTGFAKNQYGWWYIEKGNVTFKKNEVTYGKVNGSNGWWNVKGSNVKFNESVEQNRHGWWYVKNGKVDFGYTGFAKNQHGWWYVEKGNVTFKKNEVTYGKVNGSNGWWNVKGSNVKFNESVEQNRHGWWYVKNGKVDFGYTGFAKNPHGWWYIEKGNVTFKKNGSVYGTVNNKKSWWNVKSSYVTGETKTNAGKTQASTGKSTIETVTVTFTDGNGKTLSTQKVEKGKSATAPEVPVKEGNEFVGWNKSFNNVSTDLTVSATWKMVNMVDLRNNTLKRINSERKKAGLGEVKMLAILNECSQEKSKDMYVNKKMNHYSPTLAYMGEQFESHGLVAAMLAENLAVGNTNYNFVVDGWLNSKEHRDNMLNPNLKQIGIGYYNGYWTLQMVDELMTENVYDLKPVDKCCYCGEEISKVSQHYAVCFKYSNEEEDYQWLSFPLYCCKENNKIVRVDYSGRDSYDRYMGIMKKNYKNEKDIFNNISWYRETYDSNAGKFVQSKINTPKVYDLYELMYGYKP